MRCLLVADLHYDLRKFDWVINAARSVDVVVIAGDHLDIASVVDRPTQSLVVQKYFRRIRQHARLLTCSGNHDLDSRNPFGELMTQWIAQARYYGVPTDGDSLRIGDTLFTLCPWSGGARSRIAIGEHLARDAAVRPDQWVWVYHAPPEGSRTSWDGRKSFGDPALRAWVLKHKPDMVLSGHVHQSPFTRMGSWADRIGRTWLFNAGHQIGPEPSHIVVDTDTPGAYWISLAGARQVALDGPVSWPIAEMSDLPAWLRSMARVEDPPPA